MVSPYLSPSMYFPCEDDWTEHRLELSSSSCDQICADGWSKAPQELSFSSYDRHEGRAFPLPRSLKAGYGASHATLSLVDHSATPPYDGPLSDTVASTVLPFVGNSILVGEVPALHERAWTRFDGAVKRSPKQSPPAPPPTRAHTVEPVHRFCPVLLPRRPHTIEVVTQYDFASTPTLSHTVDPPVIPESSDLNADATLFSSQTRSAPLSNAQAYNSMPPPQLMPTPACMAASSSVVFAPVTVVSPAEAARQRMIAAQLRDIAAHRERLQNDDFYAFHHRHQTQTQQIFENRLATERQRAREVEEDRIEVEEAQAAVQNGGVPDQ